MELHPPADERAPVNMEELVAAASRVAGFAVAPGDVALVLVNVPINDFYTQHAARVRWAVWDKETDINGVPPERVMARSDYPGGEIYLIYIDGQLVFLQPHLPHAGDPVWADEVQEVAALHAATIVSGYVFEDIVHRVASAATPPVDDLRELLRRGGQ